MGYVQVRKALVRQRLHQTWLVWSDHPRSPEAVCEGLWRCRGHRTAGNAEAFLEALMEALMGRLASRNLT